MNNIAYRFRPETGEYLGAVQLQENWKEPGTYLPAANSTNIAPPETGEQQAAVFDGTSWQLVADYRNQACWLADGSQQAIAELGPLPDGTSLKPPPPSMDELRAAALAQLPDWEASERMAGIDHGGSTWLTTPAALQDIRDALLAGMVPGGMWVDASGAVVPMTLPDLQSLWADCVGRGTGIYQRRLAMAAAIASMTRAQLNKFTPGWS
ncbi:DUF4376 domain-containing protein [Silvimonas soli]|uniref:DUF4376 domain-containing protein n=1 Tax=Silvimonas soli TaxID=2980100 RepID=UPI0024B3311D|nr:DUF4376 domain-containing protein [Silvimonas soli]